MIVFDSVHCTQVVSYTGQVEKKSRLNMKKIKDNKLP